MQPVFSQPGPASRSQSSMCTSSSGADTPPLSVEEGSSQSEGSQSSIDLSSISIVLSNSTYPQPNSVRDRVRACARGDGHRRRISQARMSRSSVYETIEEEMTTSSSLPPSPHSSMSEKSSIREVSHGHSSVYIVDPDAASIDSFSMWDDESGISSMWKYHD